MAFRYEPGRGFRKVLGTHGRFEQRPERSSAVDKFLSGLALVCACGSWLAPAGPLDTGGKEGNRSFYVHVYNYAKVDHKVLAWAEEKAARLFLQAGVEPIWVTCPRSQQEIGQYPKCHETKGLILNIRPEAGLKTTQRNHEFGFALQTTAYVFAGSLKGIVQSGVGSWPIVLGHVIAHEIGHLMLGTDSHSSDGVMRARLGPEDWRRASVGQLSFNASQRERIRSFVAQVEPA